VKENRDYFGIVVFPVRVRGEDRIENSPGPIASTLADSC
jgi:hypothetical protein